MATYKVIQDIEAEDKLIGWLTLKQFIYAIAVVLMGLVAFKLATIKWFLALPFIPPMLIFGILSAPLGRDQPTEVWLLAKIRFFIKPRRRIWNQTGMVELVTITVPKKIDQHLSSNMSQTEVKSRLHALANTIDSRGWAVKNINVNLSAQPAYALGQENTDRLIDMSVLPKEVSNLDIQATDDMLDMQNNPVAQQLDQMIHTSAQNHRGEVLEKMKEANERGEKMASGSSDWFTGHASDNEPAPAGDGTTLPANMKRKAPLAADEKALLEKVHKSKAVHKKGKKGHVILPIEEQVFQNQEAPKSAQASMTPPPDPAIINLANRDDLTVATIARQANQEKKQSSDDEVVISLR